MVSSAKTNLSTETTSTHPSSTLPSLKYITSLVSIKFDKSNYLFWKSHMLPLFHCQDLFQITENPSYVQWRKFDQLLLSWINATLTKPILAQIVGLNTTREVWNSLGSSFASNNAARV
ncbi:hypothetical protein MKX01_009642 [Papaver californicum]|nr:hypothetical protein MKX01_009642 [Papaver californicum]